MKKYIVPKIEIVRFDNNNIVTDSGSLPYKLYYGDESKETTLLDCIKFNELN